MKLSDTHRSFFSCYGCRGYFNLLAKLMETLPPAWAADLLARTRRLASELSLLSVRARSCELSDPDLSEGPKLAVLVFLEVGLEHGLAVGAFDRVPERELNASVFRRDLAGRCGTG